MCRSSPWWRRTRRSGCSSSRRARRTATSMCTGADPLPLQLIMLRRYSASTDAHCTPHTYHFNLYLRLIATKAHKLRLDVVLQMRKRTFTFTMLKIILWQSCVFTMHTSCKHRWPFSSLPQHCRWGEEFWHVLGCDSSHGCWHSSRWKSLVGEQELSTYSNFDQNLGPSSLNKSWSKLDCKYCNVKPCSGPVTWSKLSVWGKSKREESRERKGPCRHRLNLILQEMIMINRENDGNDVFLSTRLAIHSPPPIVQRVENSITSETGSPPIANQVAAHILEKPISPTTLSQSLVTLEAALTSKPNHTDTKKPPPSLVQDGFKRLWSCTCYYITQIIFSGRTWRRGGAVCPRLPPPCDLLCLLHVLHVGPALLLLQPARLRHHVHVLHGLHHGHVHVPRAAGHDDLQAALLPSCHTAKNEPLPLYSTTRAQVT